MNNKVLVLFSGGMDSFLTACRLVSSGKKAVLISFNSGGVIGEENLRHGANRLIRRFGEDHIEYVGVYPTVATVMRMNRTWVYARQDELGEKYSSLTNCQLQCLHCQTAMWVAAIAYCKAKDINSIAAGYKKTDIFCTGMNDYRNRIVELASDYCIQVDFPVWEIESDSDREMEVGLYQFQPSVLEPKCLLGNPVKNGFPLEERIDLIKFFDENIRDNLKEYIDNLIPVLKNIKIGDTAFDVIHYPDMNEEIGLF